MKLSLTDRRIEHRIEVERADAARDAQKFCIVLCADALVYTLNKKLGFGAARCNEFVNEFFNTLNEFANEFNADTNDIEYSMGKIDRALKPIYDRAHQDFDEWHKRYKGTAVETHGKADTIR